ncbi:MAG: M16 family metallopeptidase [Gammaproteobacteria bacterium]
MAGLFLSLLLSPMTGFMSTALAANAVSEYTLDNGMKVVVMEDHRAPVAVAQVWYRVGSSYEHGGITGVSHVLEHMMFKGTANHGSNDYSRIISANGGQDNAFTSSDYTAYYAQIEASRLEVVLELEADRMRHATLDPMELKKELKVVMEERRLRTDDNPRALTHEQFRATAYVASPARNPVIGWMNDLKNLDVDDVRSWYRTWYAPNNAILVVVGDVQPAQVHALARKHFGPLRAETPPDVKPRVEPEQLGPRQIEVRQPAKLPYLLMGFKVPSRLTAEKDREWEPYALEVLSEILDGGESARFGSNLTRGAEIASSAGVSYDLYDRLRTLFTFIAVPREGHDIDSLRAALLNEVRKVAEEPIPAAELARVKTRAVASSVYERDSVMGQAVQIGAMEAVGLGWRELDAYVERIDAVTAEQVRAVARKYFVPERMTVAVLDPQPLNDVDKGPLRGFRGTK